MGNFLFGTEYALEEHIAELTAIIYKVNRVIRKHENDIATIKNNIDTNHQTMSNVTLGNQIRMKKIHEDALSKLYKNKEWLMGTINELRHAQCTVVTTENLAEINKTLQTARELLQDNHQSGTQFETQMNEIQEFHTDTFTPQYPNQDNNEDLATEFRLNQLPEPPGRTKQALKRDVVYYSIGN